MKTLSSMIFEEVLKKDIVISELESLSEIAESDLELTMIEFLISVVENDQLNSNSFEALYDIADSLDQDDVSEHEILNVTDDELDEVISLQKKKGYVKCPNGKIRKRGNCGKPIDRKKSKQLKKFRKSGAGKIAFRKAAVRAIKTKKRRGNL